ncbi:MAG TPA: response regulator, partial [Verrucomicrobiae bacterium]|nr:response regulator [Verrucomicrobiae bacterium]
MSHNGLALAMAVLVAAGVGLWKLVDVFSRRFRFRAKSDRWQNLLLEDPSLAGFFTELRDGLSASPLCNVSESLDSLNGLQPQTGEDTAADPLQEFFAAAPSQVVSLRTLFSEISRAPDEATRQSILLEFHRRVSDLKDLAQLPEVRPFGLMAYALVGLLKQLASNASEVTPSALRTVAGAVDLLENLCVRGLNPSLAAEPPVRLLAVDDDAVSRLAISFALRKAFNEPDLAPDGEAALGLIARQSYDVIFLDVDMPGMDGFELCTKIRQTVSRTTPVVFVTRHSDFNSRAKSTLSGGQDLIGKPFLAFEITVKALTLALRGRLQNGTSPVTAPSVESLAARTEDEPCSADIPVRGFTGHSCPVSVEPNLTLPPCGLATGKSPEPADRNVCATPTAVQGFNARSLASGDDSPDAFLGHTSFYLEQLRNHLQAAQRAAEPAELQRLLCELFFGVRSLSLEAEQTQRRTVSRLGSALEGMLKKLVENPKLCTPSTLNAAAAALDLLDDLCWTGFNPDLANPPVGLLVVDDDPVARRAVCGSLQLAFERPESAESGEAACALAAEKTFDLIFLDVLMPGIDGFATCRKIRETGLNLGTPMVFVTGYDDMQSREQAAVSGG